MEQAYIFGLGGKGSAARDLVPTWASNFGVSKDLVTLTQVNEVNRDAGFVAKIEYPYSSERYDAAHDLFDQGHFALYNPNRPNNRPLELFVAATLLELQALVKVRIVRQTNAVIADDEETVRAVELSPAVSGCVLIPFALHTLRASVGEEAAQRGRERTENGMAALCIQTRWRGSRGAWGRGSAGGAGTVEGTQDGQGRDRRAWTGGAHGCGCDGQLTVDLCCAAQVIDRSARSPSTGRRSASGAPCAERTLREGGGAPGRLTRRPGKGWRVLRWFFSRTIEGGGGKGTEGVL